MWKATLPLEASVSVLRHGESENNRLGIECTSIANKDLYGLTAAGVEQVTAVASERREFDAILHSHFGGLSKRLASSRRTGAPL